MQPYLMTLEEWNEGVYFHKELIPEEKARLVHYGVMSPTSKDALDKNPLRVHRATLDGSTVWAVVEQGQEPCSSEERTNLNWTKVIPTGRKGISRQEHRDRVSTALLQGRDIPARVRGTYPELTLIEQEIDQ